MNAERYRVDEIAQDTREDCYLATLHIIDADVHDSRPYYLVVENERGIDRHAINLVVEGTFSGALSNFYFCLACVVVVAFVPPSFPCESVPSIFVRHISFFMSPYVFPVIPQFIAINHQS